MDIDLALISRSLTYGDWKLCYHILRNMDALTAAEWMQCLTGRLRCGVPPPTLPPSCRVQGGDGEEDA
jgi:hypothetical protein